MAAVAQVMLKGGGWAPLSGTVASVTMEPVPCTLTRMDIFDKLSGPEAQPALVRPTGELVRRMEETREGFQVGGGALLTLTVASCLQGCWLTTRARTKSGSSI